MLVRDGATILPRVAQSIAGLDWQETESKMLDAEASSAEALFCHGRALLSPGYPPRYTVSL
jgi:hypothetical protein